MKLATGLKQQPIYILGKKCLLICKYVYSKNFIKLKGISIHKLCTLSLKMWFRSLLSFFVFNIFILFHNANIIQYSINKEF